MSNKTMHDRIIAGELAVPTLNFTTQLVTTASGEPIDPIYQDLAIEIDACEMEDLVSFSYCSGSIDFDSATMHADSHEIELDDEIEIAIDQEVEGTLEPGDLTGTPVALFDFGVSLLATALEKMSTGAVANGRTIQELSSERDKLQIERSFLGEKATKAKGSLQKAKVAIEENRSSDAIDAIDLAIAFLLACQADDVDQEESG